MHFACYVSQALFVIAERLRVYKNEKKKTFQNTVDAEK